LQDAKPLAPFPRNLERTRRVGDLFVGDNLERFLRLRGCTYPVHPEQAGTSSSTRAYLRDLWDHRLESNEENRELITAMLATDDVRSLSAASVAEWNTHFGVETPIVSFTTSRARPNGRWRNSRPTSPPKTS